MGGILIIILNFFSSIIQAAQDGDLEYIKNYLNEEGSKLKKCQNFLKLIEKVIKTKGWQGLYLIHIVNLFISTNYASN